MAVDISSYNKDKTLYLFTSLAAGSSHVVTATSRMETILKANQIPFKFADLSSDEKAKALWTRRARGQKLPGLMREGYFVGSYEEVEEWNEYDELLENIGDDIEVEAPLHPTKPYGAGANTEPNKPSAPPVTAEITSEPSVKSPTEVRSPTSAKSPVGNAQNNPMRQLGEEAAARAKKMQKDRLKAATDAMKPKEEGKENIPLNEEAGKPKEESEPKTEATTDTTAETKVEAPNDKKEETNEPESEEDSSEESDESDAEEKDDKTDTSAPKEPVSKPTEDTAKSMSPAEAEAQSPLPAATEDASAETKDLEVDKLTLSPAAVALPSSAGIASGPDSAAVSTTSMPISAPNSPSLKKHRGSSVTEANEDEIKEVEAATAIPEDPAAEDEADPTPAKSDAASPTIGGSKIASEETKAASPTTEETKPADEETKSTSEEKEPSEKTKPSEETKPDPDDQKPAEEPAEPSPKEPDAAAPEKAGESVKD